MHFSDVTSSLRMAVSDQLLGIPYAFFIIEPSPARCSHIPLLSQKVTLDAADTRKPGVLMSRVQNIVIKKHHIVIISLVYHQP